MPLPDNQTPWPVGRHAKSLAQMAEWSAWYSGDTAELGAVYQDGNRASARTRPAQMAGGVVGRVARWFWGTPTAGGEQPAKLHVPLAADLCGTSADLLFSEGINLTAEDQSLQDALDELQENGLDAELHQAAEVTAALGGGYLRTVWDEDLSPMPWTDTVHADMALPEFRWGKLVGVTFWQRLPSIGNEGAQVVWRLLERHESGRILHALYRGTADNLGLAVPLQEHPDAEHLALIVDADGAVPTGTDRLTATYIPNMLPNRLDRGSNQGRSDLQGVEPLLDALDEAYSSWWRDIRHAKSRLHVPATYLDTIGPGQGAVADIDREVYVPLEGVMGRTDGQLAIHAQQFAIRVQEHKDTCEAWTQTIIESAGYSTQSLSSGTGGAVTAAEVHSHERRSYMTRGKKVRYWRAGIRDHLTTLVEVANANLGAGIREGDFKVEFKDGVQESALSLAQTAMAMRNAEAASVNTRVQLLHPDWTQDQVDDEAASILAESGGAPLPDPMDAGL